MQRSDLLLEGAERFGRVLSPLQGAEAGPELFEFLRRGRMDQLVDQLTADARLLASAEKRGVNVSALTGEAMEKLVSEAMNIPDTLAAKIRAMVAPE